MTSQVSNFLMRIFPNRYTYQKGEVTRMTNKEICVFISLANETLPAGKLRLHQGKGKETALFEYTPSWLQHPERFALEPSLTLGFGSFHTQENADIFGSFSDSAPDRWGRVLMRRAHIASHKHSNTTPTTLLESDYLLRVSDEARQGALRFSIPDKPNLFLNPTNTLFLLLSSSQKSSQPLNIFLKRVKAGLISNYSLHQDPH